MCSQPNREDARGDPFETVMQRAFGREPRRRAIREGQSAFDYLQERVGTASSALALDVNEEAATVTKPGALELDERPRGRPRYRVAGEIARGGVGRVFKGRDHEIGRDVAIKVLLERHAANSAMVRRFLEEAQIEGQLEHPGVVPVHEVGYLNDNRPFFTMKLVKGETLSVLLRNRKAPREDRRRFLAIFEKVLETMAYAHSNGVIHRDLKPSNIMVGAFGEIGRAHR